MEEVIARSSMEQVPSSENMEMSKDDNKKLPQIAQHECNRHSTYANEYGLLCTFYANRNAKLTFNRIWVFANIYLFQQIQVLPLSKNQCLLLSDMCVFESILSKCAHFSPYKTCIKVCLHQHQSNAYFVFEELVQLILNTFPIPTLQLVNDSKIFCFEQLSNIHHIHSDLI